ncbi:PucR family transcriptional regulator [Domibacillus robiginosus]|uniref:PucR family transcriptional regulator n=1 Tax=Domibacillus robiginosus TaxID=1071054 RepID=UPI00067B87D5|nr:helix-turn-helix domain-containing protein [Domibacillus robiginosus]
MQNIEMIYERAIVTEQPEADKSRLHYYDKGRNRYISIPKEDVSGREEQLLSHFFVPISQDGEASQSSSLEQAWWAFLIKDGECPAAGAQRIRFLYMKLTEHDRDGFLKAVDTFFDHALLVVWTGDRECILIEEASDYPIQKEDGQTFLDVLAGDFYIAGRLFIGRFGQAADSLRDTYKRETEAARKAALFIPEQRVTTIEMVVPHLFLAGSRAELSSLFAEEQEWFEADEDLRNTLQLLIQNHLNVSQTAKQLHLHRNSLQYRIDKFVDRTGIDVRSYEGAMLVYMICLMSAQK